MWLDNASQEAISLFWRRCGEIEPFPRRLEGSIALALPVSVIKLPYLKLNLIEQWLTRRGALFRFDCRSRAVRGCLIAFGGEGLIFVDGADPEEEQRFTLAHEVAHFIVDYWLVREAAIRKLGRAIAEVFDGARPPSVAERVHALLVSASIGVHTELMERDEASGKVHSGMWEIEDRADKVGLALLAPPERVLAEADITAVRFAERLKTLSALLTERYGLPAGIATAYGRSLLTAAGCGPSWAETLQLK